MINALKRKPFDKSRVLSILNSLFPPSVKDLPNDNVDPRVMEGQRAEFYRIFVDVENRGPHLANMFEAMLLDGEHKHSWPKVRRTLEKYWQLASDMIEEVSKIHGLELFSSTPPTASIFEPRSGSASFESLTSNNSGRLQQKGSFNNLRSRFGYNQKPSKVFGQDGEASQMNPSLYSLQNTTFCDPSTSSRSRSASQTTGLPSPNSKTEFENSASVQPGISQSSQGMRAQDPSPTSPILSEFERLVAVQSHASAKQFGFVPPPLEELETAFGHPLGSGPANSPIFTSPSDDLPASVQSPIPDDEDATPRPLKVAVTDLTANMIIASEKDFDTPTKNMARIPRPLPQVKSPFTTPSTRRGSSDMQQQPSTVGSETRHSLDSLGGRPSTSSPILPLAHPLAQYVRSNLPSKEKLCASEIPMYKRPHVRQPTPCYPAGNTSTSQIPVMSGANPDRPSRRRLASAFRSAKKKPLDSNRSRLPSDNFNFLERPFTPEPVPPVPAIKKKGSLSNLFRRQKSSTSMNESFKARTPSEDLDFLSQPFDSTPVTPILKKKSSFSNVFRRKKSSTTMGESFNAANPLGISTDAANSWKREDTPADTPTDSTHMSSQSMTHTPPMVDDEWHPEHTHAKPSVNISRSSKASLKHKASSSVIINLEGIANAFLESQRVEAIGDDEETAAEEVANLPDASAGPSPETHEDELSDNSTIEAKEVNDKSESFTTCPEQPVKTLDSDKPPGLLTDPRNLFAIYDNQVRRPYLRIDSQPLDHTSDSDQLSHAHLASQHNDHNLNVTNVEKDRVLSAVLRLELHANDHKMPEKKQRMSRLEMGIARGVTRKSGEESVESEEIDSDEQEIFDIATPRISRATPDEVKERLAQLRSFQEKDVLLTERTNPFPPPFQIRFGPPRDNGGTSVKQEIRGRADAQQNRRVVGQQNFGDSNNHVARSSVDDPFSETLLKHPSLAQVHHEAARRREAQARVGEAQSSTDSQNDHAHNQDSITIRKRHSFVQEIENKPIRERVRIIREQERLDASKNDLAPRSVDRLRKRQSIVQKEHEEGFRRRAARDCAEQETLRATPLPSAANSPMQHHDSVTQTFDEDIAKRKARARAAEKKRLEERLEELERDSELDTGKISLQEAPRMRYSYAQDDDPASGSVRQHPRKQPRLSNIDDRSMVLSGDDPFIEAPRLRRSYMSLRDSRSTGVDGHLSVEPLKRRSSYVSIGSSLSHEDNQVSMNELLRRRSSYVSMRGGRVLSGGIQEPINEERSSSETNPALNPNMNPFPKPLITRYSSITAKDGTIIREKIQERERESQEVHFAEEERLKDNDYGSAYRRSTSRNSSGHSRRSLQSIRASEAAERVFGRPGMHQRQASDPAPAPRESKQSQYRTLPSIRSGDVSEEAILNRVSTQRDSATLHPTTGPDYTSRQRQHHSSRSTRTSDTPLERIQSHSNGMSSSIPPATHTTFTPLPTRQPSVRSLRASVTEPVRDNHSPTSLKPLVKFLQDSRVEPAGPRSPTTRKGKDWCGKESIGRGGHTPILVASSGTAGFSPFQSDKVGAVWQPPPPPSPSPYAVGFMVGDGGRGPVSGKSGARAWLKGLLGKARNERE